MIVRLPSGSRLPERAEELLACLLDTEVAAPEALEQACGRIAVSPFAHQAGIDVIAADALLAERSKAQCIGDGRIHASANEEKNVPIAGHLANPLLNEWNTMPRVPVRCAPGNLEEEVGKDLLALVGVNNFRVKLHAI